MINPRYILKSDPDATMSARLLAVQDLDVPGSVLPTNIKAYVLQVNEQSEPIACPSRALHSHYGKPLTASEFQQLLVEIGIHLADQPADSTFSFFHKTEQEGWLFTSARLNKTQSSTGGEIVALDYPINNLPLEKGKLTHLLDNLGYFKEHYPRVATLTCKEKEIIAMIAEGLQTRDIALASHTSIHTINTHRKNINRKLKTKTLSDLVHIAGVFDLIHPAHANKV